MTEITTVTEKELIPIEDREIEELKWIERFTTLLETNFRIPFTQVRFGLDPILGLIPGIGDLISYGISSVLLLAMVRHGVSGMVVIRMIFNLLLDVTVGGIPGIGDLFDLFYKANTRNLNLLKEHYEEGKYQGSGWWVFLLVFLVLGLILFGLIFGIWKMFSLLIGLF